MPQRDSQKIAVFAFLPDLSGIFLWNKKISYYLEGGANKGDIMNIYVGNMPYSMTEEDLKGIFSVYGSVSSARLVMDRETGRAKGFGFVEMDNDNEAKAAIEAVNGSNQGGRDLKVNEARPREERPPRRNFGHGGVNVGVRRF